MNNNNPCCNKCGFPYGKKRSKNCPCTNEKSYSHKKALEIAMRFGGISGEHHKAWAIDQMVRALTGDGYAEWVRKACDGEDGPNTYDWDQGIAP